MQVFYFLFVFCSTGVFNRLKMDQTFIFTIELISTLCFGTLASILFFKLLFMGCRIPPLLVCGNLIC